MAKALKTAAVVAGVAALVVVTGGAAAGFGVTLATSIGVGGLTVSAGALIAASTAFSLGAAALTKAPKAPTAQIDRLTANVEPRAFRKSVLGSTAMPVDVRFVDWWGTDQERCGWIVAHASHAIGGIDEIWLDDTLAWTAAGGAQGKYSGYFWVRQTVLEGSAANAFTFGSGKWNGQHRLTGCAYSLFEFKVTGNSKKTESPFANGIPSRVTAIGRGAALYDPRRDSTVPGGSGPMRADDQSTWRYITDDGATIGENLPLQILRTLLGGRIAGKVATGFGVPPRRLDLASFAIAASLADELVNRSAGGTEPRYRGAGVISEGDDRRAVLEQLCAACCARFRDAGGKLGIAIMHNDLAAAATDPGLGDDDVVGPFTWDPDASLDATPNIVRGKYTDPSPASLYQQVDFPEVSLPSVDGIDRVFPLDLAWVESPSQAQRVVKQGLQRKQYQGRRFSAPFDITAWRYNVGDLVPFTFAPLGFVRKVMRVVETDPGSNPCRLVLEEESAAIYAWDADDRAPVVAATPTIYDRTNSPILKAIDDAATTSEWAGVSGPGKPADNATNSADPTSPFGPDGTVGGAVEKIDTVKLAADRLKASFDTLESTTIPAIGAAVDDAGRRIVTAQGRADEAFAKVGTEADRLDQRINRVVAEGTYDDAPLRAEVSRVDRAAIAGDKALGERVDTVSGSIDPAINAKAQEITRAFAAADLALSTRTGVLEATASSGKGAENANPDFSAWPDGQPLPTAWVPWGASGPCSRVAASLGAGGWAAERVPSDIDAGMAVPDVYLTGGWYVLYAKVWKTRGSWNGAGLTWGGVTNVDFMAEPDLAGKVGDADTGGVREWAALRYIDPANSTYRSWHAMDNWSGWGRGFADKTLRWHSCGIRRASEAEVKAGKADAALNAPGGVLARLTSTDAALADLPNRYSAVQRTDALEAQVNFGADSGLQRTINARIEDRASAIADAKAGAVAESVRQLNADYGGRIATAEEKFGVISDLQGRTAAYLKLGAAVGDNRRELTLWADANGGGGVNIVGDVAITGASGAGRVVITGAGLTVFDANNVIRVRIGFW